MRMPNSIQPNDVAGPRIGPARKFNPGLLGRRPPDGKPGSQECDPEELSGRPSAKSLASKFLEKCKPIQRVTHIRKFPARPFSRNGDLSVNTSFDI
jgi:hypothetical protein